MGTPCDPLTPRQELIAELEGLGFDAEAGALDWRIELSDETLKAALDTMRDRGIADFPDISELINPLQELLAADDAVAAAEIAFDQAHQRRVAAWERCRAVNARIALAQAAHFAKADA